LLNDAVIYSSQHLVATDWTVRGSNLLWERYVCLLRNVQTGPGAQPVSYWISTGGRAVGAWS